MLKNKKLIFINNFKYAKGIVFLFYMKIIIIISILNLSINSPPYFIELTISGPGKSRVFFESTISNEYCPNRVNQTFPNKIIINDIEQIDIISEYDFNNTENIVKLEFNNNNVNFHCYFYYCSNITKIDFINFIFDNSISYNMRSLCEGCTSLININFPNDISNIFEMASMFDNCQSLVSIDLSHFISTDSLQYLGSSFKNCISLKYINLSNLNTKNVQNMDSMFYNCKSLTSLDLSNFDFSSVVWIESMFDGCKQLEYLNLKNVTERETFNQINYLNIFRGIPDNIIICLIEQNTRILTSLIKNKRCPIIYCEDNWEQKQKQRIKCKIICDEDNPYELIDTKECVNSCDINQILSGKCVFKYKNNKNDKINKDKKQEEIKLQDKFLENIEEGFTSENYNTSGIDNGNDEIIQYNKMTITLTTTDNQRNNDNNDITTIDFGE